MCKISCTLLAILMIGLSGGMVGSMYCSDSEETVIDLPVPTPEQEADAPIYR